MQPGDSLDALAMRLAAYIGTREPGLGEPRVDGLERLGAGSSREMYRCRVVWPSSGSERRIILRMDPPGQGLVAISERRIEYGVIAALKTSDVPVPEVFWLEEDPSHLGAQFFAMTEIGGCETDGALFDGEPYSPLRPSVGRDKWTIMGSLARLDPAAIGVTDLFPPSDPALVWREQLDFWEAMVEANRLGPQPVTVATIRHLRRNPPPPAQKIALVHGDYRTGNFLFGPDGRVHAVLDWEMAHLGDPLEDLAYSLTRQYASANGRLAGNLAPVDQAIAWWEAASGLTVDPEALRWWRLFTTVKFQGLWASGAAGWQSGGNNDLVLIAASWSCGATHEREALELMGRA